MISGLPSCVSTKAIALPAAASVVVDADAAAVVAPSLLHAANTKSANTRALIFNLFILAPKLIFILFISGLCVNKAL